MATVYSSEVSVGTYNRIRLKCDYSGTSATMEVQFRRTSSYTGSWADSQATLTFNSQSKAAAYSYSGTVGTSWVVLKSGISGYTISTSGGTYNWTFNNPGGSSVLGCSGTITIPSQETTPTTPTTAAYRTGTTTVRVTYGTTSFGTAGSGTVYLYGGTSASPTTQIDSKTTTGNSNYVHSSLNANTRYYYRSRAKSSVGWSNYSADSSDVTLSGPSSISVSDYGTTSITISYTTRAGGGVYAQNVQYSLDGGTTWTTGATVAAGTTASTTGSFTISGLTSGTTYTINTRITTTSGSANGTTLTQKTAELPTVPTLSTVQTNANKNTITFGTTSFGYPDAGHVYLYGGTSASPTTQLKDKTSTGDSTYEHSSLTPNTTYYYRARARNQKVWNSYSADKTATTRSKVTDASITAYDYTSITISYTLAAGGGVNAQKVQYSLDGGTTWSDASTYAAGTTAAQTGTKKITGLTPGATYNISIRALNSNKGQAYGTVLTQTLPNRCLYASVNGQTKKVSKLYCSVSGQTKKVKKLYASVNGVTKLIQEW